MSLDHYYLVERDGERCAVYVDHLTHIEFMAKCQEMRLMAAGCLEHEQDPQGAHTFGCQRFGTMTDNDHPDAIEN